MGWQVTELNVSHSCGRSTRQRTLRGLSRGTSPRLSLIWELTLFNSTSSTCGKVKLMSSSMERSERQYRECTRTSGYTRSKDERRAIVSDEHGDTHSSHPQMISWSPSRRFVMRRAGKCIRIVARTLVCEPHHDDYQIPAPEWSCWLVCPRRTNEDLITYVVPNPMQT